MLPDVNTTKEHKIWAADAIMSHRLFGNWTESVHGKMRSQKTDLNLKKTLNFIFDVFLLNQNNKGSSYCSDFRCVSNGILVLGRFFFSSDKFDFLTSHF